MTRASIIRKSCGGFTLAEVAVSTLLVLTLLATMLSAYRFQMFALKRQESQIDVQETARSILDIMAREIRHAGYDPLCVKTFAGVNDARPQRLQVQFDRNADGVLGADEAVTYAYDPEESHLARTSAGATVPLATELGATSLSFGYFDGAGTQLVPTGTPATLTAAQRTSVRRIRVALRIQREGPEPASVLPVISEFVSNVSLRNRFLNGGVGCP